MKQAGSQHQDTSKYYVYMDRFSLTHYHMSITSGPALSVIYWVSALN